MRYRAETPDRRFLDWHYTLSPRWLFMDLDGVPACGRCWYPIALIETTTNPKKAPAVLRRLSLLSRLPAYLLLFLARDGQEPFTGSEPMHWRVVGPGPEQWEWNRGLVADWADEEARLRQEHRCH